MNASLVRSGLSDFVRAGVLMFSAVAFATLQFFAHAMPSPDIVYVPTSVVVYTVVGGVLAPSILLLAADRAIVAMDHSGVWVKRYRAAVLAVASILILRQLQLYFGPAGSLFAVAGAAEGLLFAAVAMGIGYSVARWYEPVRQFYTTAAPLVALFAVITMVQMTQAYELPATYAAETPAGAADNPPVFVIVADEFSYDVLTEGGQIDNKRFPNIAALAGESAWFTNATTNHVHTTFVVPKFIEATTHLSDDYQLRLYSQYAYVESLAWDECGQTFTCRGAAHMGQSHQAELVGSIFRRALFQTAPEPIDRALAPVSGWMDGALYTPAPNVDSLGMHTFTTRGFESFLGDVNSETAPGSLYFYHVLLPHEPMAFKADGSIRASIPGESSDEEKWERYSQQTSYFDSLLGRFVAQLKAEGIYDDATIIITGDHGRRPYEIQGIDFSGGAPEVPSTMAHVPLLVRSPGVVAHVSGVDYQHKDFEATFLDALGREVPASDGVSAFATERPAREKTFILDQNNDRYWTYVFNEQTQTWDFVEFFDEKLEPKGVQIVPVQR